MIELVVDLATMVMGILCSAGVALLIFAVSYAIVEGIGWLVDN